MFEIGGQDSKYVRLEHGAIVDFTMTRFAPRAPARSSRSRRSGLGVKIIGEFGEMALASKAPANLGERCTVFMESDLNHHQQQGVPKEDLVAGLCYSIVANYLNRVVEDRSVGDCVFFRAGVAANRGVVAAFERVTGKKIVVPAPPRRDGAIGCALIAQKEGNGVSRFRGFDLNAPQVHPPRHSSAGTARTCARCAAWPSRASRRSTTAAAAASTTRRRRPASASTCRACFREPRALAPHLLSQGPARPPKRQDPRIPRITSYFEMFPFWKAFFTEAGFKVVTSGKTNRTILREGLGAGRRRDLFPVKAAHGHVLDLLRREVDYLFLPSIVNLKPRCEGRRTPTVAPTCRPCRSSRTPRWSSTGTRRPRS